MTVEEVLIWEMAQGTLHLSCKAKCRSLQTGKQLLALTTQTVVKLSEATSISVDNIILDVRKKDSTDDSDDPEIAC